MFPKLYSSWVLLCAFTLLGSPCLGGTIPDDAIEISDNLAEFECMFNLLSNNEAQIDNGNDSFRLVQVTIIPFGVIPLSQKPWVYLLQKVDGKVYRENLVEFTEDENGVITGTPFNITKTKIYKTDLISKQDLLNLTRDDLVHNPGCTTAYKKISERLFKGTFTDCRHDKVNGEYAIYDVIMDCDSVKALAPSTSLEAGPDYYHFKRSGKRFPVTRAKKGFVCPCDRS